MRILHAWRFFFFRLASSKLHDSFTRGFVASYPGLLAPVFVACSTNAGEGLVKLSHTFLLYSCKAAFWIQDMSLGLSDVEHSVILWSAFATGSTLAYLLFFRERATPPHVQVRHTTWLSFTRPSPALVLQATNAGVRRPEYEATKQQYFTLSSIPKSALRMY